MTLNNYTLLQHMAVTSKLTLNISPTSFLGTKFPEVKSLGDKVKTLKTSDIPCHTALGKGLPICIHSF